MINDRQKYLLDLLLVNEGKWFTQHEIAYFDFNSYYKYNINPKHTSDQCPTMLADARAINNDIDVPYIITYRNYCFKIATKEEAVKEIKRHIRKLNNQVKIIKDIAYKVKMEGQLDLLNTLDIEEKKGEE